MVFFRKYITYSSLLIFYQIAYKMYKINVSYLFIDHVRVSIRVCYTGHNFLQIGLFCTC